MTLLDPASLPTLTIDFELGDSADGKCTALPNDLHTKFTAPNPDYEGYGKFEVNVAVLVIPENLDDWWGTPESKWMRQKVRGAEKLGYTVQIFEHDDYMDAIHAVNTSLTSRQGVEMSDAYTKAPEPEGKRNQTCPRHRRDWFGAFTADGTLAAYALVIQCGEMLIFTRFLGHGDYRDEGATNFLLYEVVKYRQAESGTKYAVYHLQDNGTEGLQFFKRKMGFRGHTVKWVLGAGTARPAEGVSGGRKAYRYVVNHVPGAASLGKRAKAMLKRP